jgi:hypothetical protein
MASVALRPSFIPEQFVKACAKSGSHFGLRAQLSTVLYFPDARFDWRKRSANDKRIRLQSNAIGDYLERERILHEGPLDQRCPVATVPAHTGTP